MSREDPGARAPDGAGSDIPGMVARLLRESLDAGASDLHLEPVPGGMRVRSRVDGVFREGERIPGELAEGLANRIKVMAGLAVHRNDIPQEGRILFDTDSGGRSRELRVSVMPVVHGEKVVVRFFEADGRLRPLDDLGFDEGVAGGLRSILGARDGLYLVSGPSGSGKTTTIYALLGALVERRGERLNVASLEDPVERLIAGVNQTQVRPDRGLDYAAGVRALLRQDPEVIAVSEIRDRETAEAVLTASFTGHLVISSLHCARAAEAVRRLADFGLSLPLIASSLRGVLAQRLVRVACRACLGSGCEACGRTGFRGRTAFGEYLPCGEGAVRAAIVETSDPRRIGAAGKEAGMREIGEAGRKLVDDGITTGEELDATLG